MENDKLVRLSHAISAAKTGADDWDGGCNIERDRYIEKAFADIPAVDAVEVVRCRECRYFAVATANDVDLEVHGCYLLKKLGEKYPLLAQGEGFCSWGQRREDGDGDG